MSVPENAVRDVQAVKHAQDQVIAMYNSGEPLFSKGALAEIMCRFDAFKENRPPDNIMFIPNLQGGDTRVIVSNPQVYTYGDQLQRSELEITFQPIQELVDQSRLDWLSVQAVYLPITIGYGETRPCDAAGNLQIPPSMPVEALDEEFQRTRHQWKHMAEYGAMRNLLRSLPILANVDKVVAFGCGRMTISNGEKAPEHMMQNAICFSICEIIAEMRGWVPVRLYMQEPAYTPEDKIVLDHAGAEVVDTPKAFFMVDDTSLVIAISLNIAVKQIVADIARPLGMLWYNDKNEWVRIPSHPEPVLCADPWSPRVETMTTQHYTKFVFPYPEQTRDCLFFARNLQNTAAPGQGQPEAH